MRKYRTYICLFIAFILVIAMGFFALEAVRQEIIRSIEPNIPQIRSEFY